MEWLRTNWLRFLGIILLIYLLLKIDSAQIYTIFRQADCSNVLAVTFLLFPLIALKSIRWQVILNAQGIEYGLKSAYLAYFASMFVGMLTPGRIGEFSKAVYIIRDRRVSSGLAFSGVLVDRLFDFYTIFVISIYAMISLYLNGNSGFYILFLFAPIIPVFLLLSEVTYEKIQSFAIKFGGIIGKIFLSDGWLTDMRQGLLSLNWKVLFACLVITGAAYCLYFFQCQTLAYSLDLPLTLNQVAKVVSLAGLVTLVPVSVAGLGTREAVIVFYLSGLGFPSDKALIFSLLIFLVFYFGLSVIGAIAWLIKPLPLGQSMEGNPEVK